MNSKQSPRASLSEEELPTTIANYFHRITPSERIIRWAKESGKSLSRLLDDYAAKGEFFGVDTVSTMFIHAQVVEILDEQTMNMRDFSRAFYDRRTQELITTLESLGMPPMESATQFTTSHHMVAWNKGGRHTYSVGEGLAVYLALTELRGLKSEDVRLPFKSIRIEVPDVLGFQIYDHKSKSMKPLEAVLLQDDEYLYTPTQTTTAEGRSLRVLLQSKPFFDDGSDTSAAAQSFIALPLLEGKLLDESIDYVFNRSTENGVDAEEVENWLRIWRWTLNVLMYATNPDAEADVVRGNPDAEAIWRRIQKLPKVSEKRERLKAQLRKMNQRLRTVFGKSVVLTPAMREMYDHQRRGENGNPLRVRTLVAGHHQRYAVGKGRTERVWKWIAPYWRGPEDAPVAKSTDHKLQDAK